MTAYAPASSLGWLDFDAATSERVAALLRSLEEPGTLDVLGLGTIRDAFATMLSPGTSTAQTRLRYFVFIPWILSGLEAQRVPPADFARRRRADEARLIDCLRHLGPGHGVIGYTSGRDLKHMPSALYWSGLGSWGLRRHNLSSYEYGQRAAALGRRRPERDDDNNATTRVVSMWAPLPPPPDDFLHGRIDFELRSEEALVLVDCIRRNQPGTLLAALCGTPATAAAAEYPWDVPTDGLPDRLVDVLRHARCFSDLTLGPQLVYNVLLARTARAELGWDTDDLKEDQVRRLGDWRGLVADRREELRAWAENIPDFWHVLTDQNVGAGTRSFVGAMAQHAVEDPEGFGENPEVHDHIRRRELRLKGTRAKLTHRAALENWNRAASGGRLTYRWSITQSYLGEIAKALGAGA